MTVNLLLHASKIPNLCHVPSRCILLPLLGMKPPQQSLFMLVDSVDEGCNVSEGEQTSTSLSGTIAEILASHFEFFPPWLLLLCSARKQSKAVTKMFTGEPNRDCLGSLPWTLCLPGPGDGGKHYCMFSSKKKMTIAKIVILKTHIFVSYVLGKMGSTPKDCGKLKSAKHFRVKFYLCKASMFS